MNEASYKIIKTELKKLKALIRKLEYNQSLDRFEEYHQLINEAIKLKGQACVDVYQKAFIILNKHLEDTTLEKRTLLRTLNRQAMKIGEDIANYDYAQSLRKGFGKALIIILIFTIF